jgi:hypothetical protein
VSVDRSPTTEEEEVAEQTAEERPKRRALTSGVTSLASLPRVVRATATDRSLGKNRWPGRERPGGNTTRKH